MKTIDRAERDVVDAEEASSPPPSPGMINLQDVWFPQREWIDGKLYMLISCPICKELHEREVVHGRNRVCVKCRSPSSEEAEGGPGQEPNTSRKNPLGSEFSDTPL